MFVPFLSSPFYPLLIDWIPQDSLISCLLILYIFFQLFSLVPSSHLLPKFVWFWTFPLFVLGNMSLSDAQLPLILFPLFMYEYLFLQPRLFRQLATPAALWSWVIVTFTRFPEIVLFTLKYLNSITFSTILPSISNLKRIFSLLSHGFPFMNLYFHIKLQATRMKVSVNHPLYLL